MGESHRELKKKLQYLQYKFDSITEDRSLFSRQDGYEQEDEGATRRKIKTEVYAELNKIIVKKVEHFTNDLRRLAMSADVEQRVETFLEELLYLNPYSEFHVLEEAKAEERGTHQGKIRKSNNDNITSQEEWKKLEKSL